MPAVPRGAASFDISTQLDEMANPFTLSDVDYRADGLLVVGHGTRSGAGREEFLETVRDVASQSPDLAVEAGFLELCSPGIEEGLEKLARRGVRRVVAAPLMLFAAGHVKRDIPLAIDQAARQFGMHVVMGEHLGCRRALVELSTLRFREATADLQSGDGNTLLLLVGRGSNDADATEQMLRFAELRGRQDGVAKVVVAFLAMASPPVDEVLPQVAAAGYKNVIVQPHLLFQGELLEGLRRRVEAFQAAANGPNWIVTRHLGPHPLLGQAILEIFHGAAQEKNGASEAPLGENK